jgi:hypothetical protein
MAAVWLPQCRPNHLHAHPSLSRFVDLTEEAASALIHKGNPKSTSSGALPDVPDAVRRRYSAVDDSNPAGLHLLSYMTPMAVLVGGRQRYEKLLNDSSAPTRLEAPRRVLLLAQRSLL